MKIAIIGGGISGLTTAFYLKYFNKDIEISIFEKEKYFGGKMVTVKKNEFLFETGSNGFLSNKPDTLDLVKLSGAEDILLKSDDSARVRYIYNKNKLSQLPESPQAFLKSDLLSWYGKLRVACEFFIPQNMSDEEENLREFGYRRVGKEFTDIFLDSMCAGVFASTPEKLSVEAGFPAVIKLEREYGGLFKGMIKKKKKSAGPSGVLMSFKGGVSTFIKHLEDEIDAEFINSEVLNISKNDKEFLVKLQDKIIKFDKVILSTPSYVSADLIENIDKNIAEDLRKIDYSPVSIVGFGYKNLSHDLNGFGLLTPREAKQKILGVLWDSSIFNDRAPKNKKSIRVLICGQRNKELAFKSEKELIEIAKEGIKNTMGVDDKPSTTFIKKWKEAIPSYEKGHLNLVNNIFKQIEKHNGLYLNSNAYYGVALNDCVSNSKKCAEKILNLQS